VTKFLCIFEKQQQQQTKQNNNQMDLFFGGKLSNLRSIHSKEEVFLSLKKVAKEQNGV